MTGKTSKCIYALMAALLLIFTFFITNTAASDFPTPPTVDGGHAIVLYDKTHDRYLVEQNGADMLNTSTSAKVMTGLLACELLSDRLDESVEIKPEMLSAASGRSVGLVSGERIKIRDLLYAAICGSFNDAAYVLAYLCGNSAEGFVALMNEKALSLGAKATTYTNPLGYPDSAGMITTAYDTLKIALAASDNALYMEFCSAKKHTIKATNENDLRTFSNWNGLTVETSAYYNANCLGMNAGNSGEAGGWSIVTVCRDEGADYICVLLGGKQNKDGSEIYAYESVNSLLNWACKTYDLHKIYTESAQVGTIKVGLTALGSEAAYFTASDLSVYAPRGAELKSHIELNSEIKAPLKAGDVIGKLTVNYNGHPAGECDLIVKENYEVNGMMLVLDKIGGYTKSRAFAATLIFFFVSMMILLLRRRSNRAFGRRRRKR